MKSKFMKGLELNEGYYFDVVKPIIDEYYPNLRYTAGLIGYGSDVVGFDDHISMDHNWGPRLLFFLSEEDYSHYKKKIDVLLKEHLPLQYNGLPTNFTEKSEDGTQSLKRINNSKVNHLIQFFTIRKFINYTIGVYDIEEIDLFDWLQFSDQGLIEITSGKLFHDDLGLEKSREYFAFYPDEILKLKLASLWNIISHEEAFVGRNIDVGEELGTRIISARIVNTLMKICFYLERRYIPYSKWFSLGFQKLKCSKELCPIFSDIFNLKYNSIEENIVKAYQIIIEMQNQLQLTKPIDTEVQNYYGRPYKVIFADRIAANIMESIEHPKLKGVNIDEISIIQNTDGFDLRNGRLAEFCNKLF